ncbi:hypothetical protein NFF31_001536 [Klebsiella aerogenes]|nr:hypothetical protein [Klebsiella aerogenes]
MKQFLIGAIIALLSATGYICYINFFPTTYTCTLTTEANRSTITSTVQVKDHKHWFTFQTNERVFNSGLLSTKSDDTYGDVKYNRTNTGEFISTIRNGKKYFMHVDKVARADRYFGACRAQ